MSGGWTHQFSFSKKLPRAGGTTGQILSVNHANFVVPVHINGSSLRALVDTGANVSCVRQNPSLPFLSSTMDYSHSLIAANGSSIPILGEVELRFTLDCGEFCHKFFVVNSLSYEVILGLDFLATNNISLDCKNRKLITTAAPINSLEVEKPSSLITEILKSK